METVGYSKSTESESGEPDTFDFDFDDVFSDEVVNDIFSKTEETREQNTIEAELTADKKMTAAERAETREAVRQQLVEHYGDQEFQYTKYQGTVTQIIELCPVAENFLNQGFDAVVAWIDPYAIRTTEEEAEQDEDDEKEKVLSNHPLDQKPDDAKQDVKVEASEKKAAGTTDKSMQENRDREKLEEAPVRDNITKGDADDAKVAIESVVDASYPEVLVLESKHAEHEIEISPTELAVNAEGVHETSAEPANFTSYEVTITDETPELPPEPLVESAYSENDAIRPEAVKEYEREVPDERTLPVSIVSETDAVTDLDQSDSMEEVFEEQFSEVNAIETQGDDVEYAIAEDTEVSPTHRIIEAYENWHELADQEAPLEVFMTAIADDIDEFAYDEGLDEAKESIIDQPEMRHLEASAFSEISDTELKHYAQPELFTLFVAVQSVRQSVDKIYRARTKEECKKYIEEITIELAEMLRALGYDNPEKIIRSFLASHSPESLRMLIEQLEQVLRRTMVREVHYAKAKRAQNRHAQLKKFIGFVMQALAPCHPNLTEAM